MVLINLLNGIKNFIDMINVLEKDLTKLSSIHTNSKANYFVQVDSIRELEECSMYAKKNNLKIQILGNGTNVLFTKKEYKDRLFIKLGKFFNYLNVEDSFVEIGGAYSFIRAGKKLTSLGYSDFVYMTLIPGSLGGGIRQNAGTTNEGEVKDTFISAKVYDFINGKVIEINNNEMLFSYRNSFIQEHPNIYIVLSAKFSLNNKLDDINILKEFILEKKKKKKEKEPNGFTFGSTFKSMNYPEHVWWYIDKIGLRGKVSGGAKFSEKHSNWIINNGDASALDILNLINEAKDKVLNQFNIDLITEVDLI